ncbi:coiled-coil domain-containing protein 43 [Gastrophryne carolinensis]
MAAPSEQVEAGDFGSWLEKRLEALGLDPEVYPAYIQGVLREEESPEERDEALRGILAAFLEEDSIEDVCLEIVTKWSQAQESRAGRANQEDEVEALATMMGKQAQIVVKSKEVSEGERRRKAELLAQYANITDDEEYPSLVPPSPALFKNTNLEDIMNAKKHERDAMKEASQKKKEQDKAQREKDKQAKLDRKEKEKKRTQKGERKR